MNYRDKLNKFLKEDLNVWEILCAVEVDTRMPDLSDEQFEDVVDFVYDWVMNSEILPDELIGYITTSLEDEDFTLEDFSNFEGTQKITDIINMMI